MDMKDVLREFMASATKYFGNKSEENVEQLQNRLDMLSRITSNSDVKSFDVRQVAVSESMSVIIELIGDEEVEDQIHSRIFTVLNNLASNNVLLLILESNFNISCALTTFLSMKLPELSKPTFVQCLRLLQRITHGKQFMINDFPEDLLNFMMKQIISHGEFLLPCLGILANLSHSAVIQEKLKNMENVRSFYKILTSMMGAGNDVIVILNSLLILIRARNEKLGEWIYSTQNLCPTFELVFFVLMGQPECETFDLAVSLCIELLQDPRHSNGLPEKQHLERCVKKILGILIQCTSPLKISMLLELFVTFLKSQKIKTLFWMEFFKMEAGAPETQPLMIILNWIRMDDTDVTSPVLHSALRFISHTFEMLFSANIKELESQVDIFLKWCFDTLLVKFDVDDMTAKWHCMKLARVFENLSFISADSSHQQKICSMKDYKSCVDVVEFQMKNNMLHESHNKGSALDWSSDGLEVFLNAVQFLSLLKLSTNEKLDYQSMLQDERVVPFLGAALVSHCSKKTFSALTILKCGSQCPGFPWKQLAETLSKMECASESQFSSSQMNRSTMYTGFSSSSKCPMSPMKKPVIDAKVQELIEKMENGLQVKDFKASEIMEMYEHKLESFKIKEKNLQSLTEAKANALRQSDRLVSHYRLRWSQSDAEALKLRNLLKESEKRSEIAKEQTTEAILKQKILQQEMEESRVTIQGKEQQIEEQMEAFEELIQKYEASEKNCDRLKEENASNVELNAVLQRHQETFKLQQEGLKKEFSELEAIKESLAKQLKQSDNKVKDLIKNQQKLENRLSECEDELENATNELATTQENLKLTEKENKSLTEKVSLLEASLHECKSTLKDKDENLKTVMEELEHHKEITAMIQNISSGRMGLRSKKENL